MLRVACHTPHVTHRIPHSKCNMPQATHRVSHTTCHMPRATHPVSHTTPSQTRNSVNAVYRTDLRTLFKTPYLQNTRDRGPLCDDIDTFNDVRIQVNRRTVYTVNYIMYTVRDPIYFHQFIALYNNHISIHTLKPTLPPLPKPHPP